jgi:uncharacterized heparinase superfamily protein
MSALIRRRPATTGNGAAMQRLIYGNPLYRFTFFGRAPSRILGTPPELWPGERRRGTEIVRGEFVHDGRGGRVENLAQPPAEAGAEWLAWLHGFTWLSDLRALGTDETRASARRHIDEWIAAHGRWELLAWRPDVLGERLTAWMTHYGFFGTGSGEDWRGRFFRSVAMQTRHLGRSVSRGAAGRARICAVKGLIVSGLALPDNDRQLYRGLELLESELDGQILPDGGHVSRNPADQVGVVMDLLSIREALGAAHLDGHEWLSGAIERMVDMIRGLRHGDGGLALFNGSTEGDSGTLSTVLAKANAKTRNVASAPHSGFYRLSAGSTVAIMDAGVPPPRDANRWAHAGTLSLEVSSGKQRLIVNCGPGRDGEWRQALRATAAHSTVVIDDTNSSEIERAGGFRRAPGGVPANRREIDGTISLEASHDGYDDAFGLEHRRLILLSPDGGELRGEDSLIGNGGSGFAARFHLHPRVQALLAGGGETVLVKPPRGKGWTMRAAGGKLSVEDSVYLGDGTMKRSQQVVISGPLEGRGATVKWTFKRLD